MTGPGKTISFNYDDLISTISAELDKSRSVQILRKRALAAPRKAGWKNPLRAWCRQEGLTQKQLAASLGYSSRGSMMSQLINGDRGFSMKQLEKCHKVTHIPTDDLIAIHLHHRSHHKHPAGPEDGRKRRARRPRKKK